MSVKRTATNEDFSTAVISEKRLFSISSFTSGEKYLPNTWLALSKFDAWFVSLSNYQLVTVTTITVNKTNKHIKTNHCEFIARPLEKTIERSEEK